MSVGGAAVKVVGPVDDVLLIASFEVLPSGPLDGRAGQAHNERAPVRPSAW